MAASQDELTGRGFRQRERVNRRLGSSQPVYFHQVETRIPWSLKDDITSSSRRTQCAFVMKFKKKVSLMFSCQGALLLNSFIVFILVPSCGLPLGFLAYVSFDSNDTEM